MKKVAITIILFVISLSVFSYDFMLNKQAANILYDNHLLMVIHLKETENSDSLDLFLRKLKKFSVETDINISQYNFLDEHTLNIYSTNIQRDPYVHLESGTWPKADTYISNQNELIDKQRGIVSFPISFWNVRYFDFYQLRNVGVGTTF